MIIQIPFSDCLQTRVAPQLRDCLLSSPRNCPLQKDDLSVILSTPFFASSAARFDSASVFYFSVVSLRLGRIHRAPESLDVARQRGLTTSTRRARVGVLQKSFPECCVRARRHARPQNSNYQSSESETDTLTRNGENKAQRSIITFAFGYCRTHRKPTNEQLNLHFGTSIRPAEPA
jgi:hypothetical protein